MSRNFISAAVLRQTAVLYNRETAAYFSSPAAYIVLAAFLLICGYLFGSQFFLRGRSDIDTFTSAAPLLLTFFVPAVTMRLFAEENKTGTAELLSAMPVERWQVIAAKLCAGTTVIWAALALTAAYPITVTLVGRPDEGVLLSSYAGMFLMAWLYCSAGLFASALARNQISAFILGFLFCFAFYTAGKMTPLLPPHAARVAEFIGIDYHFSQFNRGIVDSRSVFYLLSTGALFVYFTTLNLMSVRTK